MRAHFIIIFKVLSKRRAANFRGIQLILINNSYLLLPHITGIAAFVLNNALVIARTFVFLTALFISAANNAIVTQHYIGIIIISTAENARVDRHSERYRSRGQKIVYVFNGQGTDFERFFHRTRKRVRT